LIARQLLLIVGQLEALADFGADAPVSALRIPLKPILEEAAKLLGICRTVAYRKGVLPTVKIAGRRLVPKTALEQMLAKTA
jgi:hypothetical protein